MKRFFTLCLLFLCFNAFSQNNKIANYNKFTLENGLTVIVLTDKSEPSITGSVFVDVGSKNDPEDATGMAHYFEHIMFKGTDKIGTVDWEKEKIFLDSISMCYDKLHNTKKEKKRNIIQKEINRLSIKAAEYAIPNETSTILSKMGGTGLNAGTSYDYTVYFNKFPSNQLENWLLVYAERFRNPVFRLFQSELEAVYEEKNMYEDIPLRGMLNDVLKTAFGNHPYGRPLIGYTEHLKNPQPNKMYEFYNTYYVANNMTLLLVGDIDIATAKPLVEKTFENLRSGELPEQKEYKLPKIKGKEVVNSKLSPIKVGFLLFKSVPANHDDYLTLDFALKLLSNGSGTGFLDKLTLNNQLIGANAVPLSFKDHSYSGFLYIPLFLGQSFDNAENLVLEAIEKVKNGEFDESDLDGLKTESLVDYYKSIEGPDALSNALLGCVSQGIEWEDYINEINEINKITKKDIVEIANKYFGEDFISYRSSMGSAKKDKLTKPDFDPIVEHNTDKSSEFAKMIFENKVEPSTPQIVEFDKDIVVNKTIKDFPLYIVKNPYNDIFNISIYYNYGKFDDKNMENAANYANLLGSNNKSFDEIQNELQKLGGTFSISSTNTQTLITISGLEENIDKILEIASNKLNNLTPDPQKTKLLLDTYNTNMKLVKETGQMQAEAVFEYFTYGDISKYINTPTKNEIASYEGTDLIKTLQNAFNYSGFIGVTSNISDNVIIDKLIKNNLIDPNKEYIKKETNYRKENNYDKSTLFYLNNKNFRQSNIYFYVQSEMLSERDKTINRCFNKYFGHDMFSIIFQEIREYRSLGYTAYGSLGTEMFNRKPASLVCYVGTQADKTTDAINTMMDIINDLPNKPEKFETAKESLINSISSGYIGFRDLPYTAWWWNTLGYNKNPNIEELNIIKDVTFNDIIEFYTRLIKGRPIVIGLSSNMKQFDLNNINNIDEFNVKELKFNDVIIE